MKGTAATAPARRRSLEYTLGAPGGGGSIGSSMEPLTTVAINTATAERAANPAGQ